MAMFDALRKQLPTRVDHEAFCRSAASVVSAHEHIGREALEYPSGNVFHYALTAEQLAQRLSDLPWHEAGLAPAPIAAACIPMPYYAALKWPAAAVPVAEVYQQRNLDTLRACANLVRRSRDGGKPDFRPLPILIVTAQEDASQFLARHRAVVDRVVALKWHPAAEQATPRAFIEAGHLDLAARLDLPIVLHCARVGSPGDLADVLDDLVPAAAERAVRINVAHAGFLHPRLPELAGKPGVFTDCCPWGVIGTSSAPPLDRRASCERLATVLASLGRQVVLGFDMPWNVQLWEDGSRHGNAIDEDLRVLIAAMSASKTDPADLLRRNAIRFLFG